MYQYEYIHGGVLLSAQKWTQCLIRGMSPELSSVIASKYDDVNYHKVAYYSMLIEIEE